MDWRKKTISEVTPSAQPENILLTADRRSSLLAPVPVMNQLTALEWKDALARGGSISELL